MLKYLLLSFLFIGTTLAQEADDFCAEVLLAQDEQQNIIIDEPNTDLPSGWYMLFGGAAQFSPEREERGLNFVLGTEFQQKIYRNYGLKLGINWELGKNFDFKIYPGIVIGGLDTSKRYKVCYIAPEFAPKSDGSSVTGVKFTGTRFGVKADFKNPSADGVNGVDVGVKLHGFDSSTIIPEIRLVFYFGPIKSK